MSPTARDDLARDSALPAAGSGVALEPTIARAIGDGLAAEICRQVGPIREELLRKFDETTAEGEPEHRQRLAMMIAACDNLLDLDWSGSA